MFVVVVPIYPEATEMGGFVYISTLLLETEIIFFFFFTLMNKVETESP